MALPLAEITRRVGEASRAALRGLGTSGLAGGKLLPKYNTLPEIYDAMGFGVGKRFTPGVRYIPTSNAAQVSGKFNKSPEFIEKIYRGPNRMSAPFKAVGEDNADYFYSQAEQDHLRQLLTNPNSATYSLETMEGLGAPGAGSKLYSLLTHNADNLVDEYGNQLFKLPDTYSGDNKRAQFAVAARAAANRIVGGEATPFPTSYVWSNAMGKSGLAVPEHLQESFGGLKSVQGLPRMRGAKDDHGWYDAMVRMNAGSVDEQDRAIGTVLRSNDLNAYSTIPELAGSERGGGLAAWKNAADEMKSRDAIYRNYVSSPGAAERALAHAQAYKTAAKEEPINVQQLMDAYGENPFKHGGLTRYLRNS